MGLWAGTIGVGLWAGRSAWVGNLDRPGLPVGAGVDLMQLLTSSAPVLIARARVGVARCVASDGPLDAATLGADRPGGHLLVARQCVDPELDLLVTAVAASEGAGPNS